MWFVEITRILKVLFSLRLKINVVGKENIPENGPVIVCFNHTDILDPFYINFALMKDMWALVASTYSKNIVIKFLTIMGRVVLVDRDIVDITALDKSIAILKSGRFLGVSPEGTRSKDGLLHKGKFGLGYLAGMTNSTILPLGIVGSYGASKRILKPIKVEVTVKKIRLKRTKVEVTVNIGEPFKLTNIDDLKCNLLQEATDEGKKNTMIALRKWRDVTNSQIMPKISELLPQEMRGDFK